MLVYSESCPLPATSWTPAGPAPATHAAHQTAPGHHAPGHHAPEHHAPCHLVQFQTVIRKDYSLRWGPCQSVCKIFSDCVLMF